MCNLDHLESPQSLFAKGLVNCRRRQFSFSQNDENALLFVLKLQAKVQKRAMKATPHYLVKLRSRDFWTRTSAGPTGQVEKRRRCRNDRGPCPSVFSSFAGLLYSMVNYSRVIEGVPFLRWCSTCVTSSDCPLQWPSHSCASLC